MRQVPHYLIIGNGRAAKHFQHYFALLKIPFSKWSRKESEEQLLMLLPKATHILILINDQAINDFIKRTLKNTKAMLIHFSGSLISKYAYGLHPLTTFNDDLYDLETYTSIPFILDHDAPDFQILFPDLSNPHWRLHTSLKSKYHALCVLSGNFSVLLWQKFFQTLEEEFNMPSSIAKTYLLQITQNLIFDAKKALTGPLVRNDNETIQNNLVALQNDPFQEVYKSFITCFEKIQLKETI